MGDSAAGGSAWAASGSRPPRTTTNTMTPATKRTPSRPRTTAPMTRAVCGDRVRGLPSSAPSRRTSRRGMRNRWPQSSHRINSPASAISTRCTVRHRGQVRRADIAVPGSSLEIPMARARRTQLYSHRMCAYKHSRRTASARPGPGAYGTPVTVSPFSATSVPRPPSMTSVPSPPSSRSLPNPPFSTSFPLPPIRVTLPTVNADASRVLLPAPPVRATRVTLFRLNDPPVDRVSRLLVRVRSASLTDTSLSVPPPPETVATWVQPLTTNVSSAAPPTRLACSMPARANVPVIPPVSFSEVSVSVNVVAAVGLPVAATRSAPRAPVRVADPVHPPTVKTLSPPSPVQLARSNPDKANAPPPLRTSEGVPRAKLPPLTDTTRSAPVPAMSVADCVQPLTVKVLFEAPPVRLACSSAASESVPTPTRLVSSSTKLALAAALTRSLPAPPSSESLPWAPVKVSSSLAPVSVSFPAPPVRRSLPTPPSRESALGPPVSVSFPTPPIRVAGPVNAAALSTCPPPKTDRNARSMPTNASVPRPAREVFFKVKFTSPDAFTTSAPGPPSSRSLPSPPVRVSSPQPPTRVARPEKPLALTRLLPGPPVTTACSTDVRLTKLRPAPLSDPSDKVWFTSAVRTMRSGPPNPPAKRMPSSSPPTGGMVSTSLSPSAPVITTPVVISRAWLATCTPLSVSARFGPLTESTRLSVPFPDGDVNVRRLMSSTLATNKSRPPLIVASNVPAVVGKSVEVVKPVRKAMPWALTVRANARSSPPPPTVVEYLRAEPAAFRRATNASFPPPGDWTGTTRGKLAEPVSPAT